MPPWLQPLTDLAGIAAVITAISLLLKSVSEIRTLSGRLDIDTISERLDATTGALGDLRDDISDLRRSVGHQIGELRRSSDLVHADYAARLRRLEDRDQGIIRR